MLYNAGVVRKESISTISPTYTMKLNLFLITAAVLASPLLAGAKATIDDVITKLENSQSPLLQYPTQLTQDIVPKQIHSHNDCMFTI